MKVLTMALLIVVQANSQTPAQETYSLRLGAEPGTEVWIKNTSFSSFRDAEGTTYEIGDGVREFEAVFRFVFLERGDDGRARLEFSVHSCHGTVTEDGKTDRFDSRTDGQTRRLEMIEHGGAPVPYLLVGDTLTYRTSATDHELVFESDLPEGMDREALRDMIFTASALLPADPVAVGSRWGSSLEREYLGLAGNLVSKRTLTKVEQGEATIAVEAEIELTKRVAPDTPWTRTKSTATGTTVISLADGMPVRASYEDKGSASGRIEAGTIGWTRTGRETLERIPAPVRKEAPDAKTDTPPSTPARSPQPETVPLVSGTVVDASGSPVAGARVVIFDDDHGTEERTTDAEGLFQGAVVAVGDSTSASAIFTSKGVLVTHEGTSACAGSLMALQSRLVLAAASVPVVAVVDGGSPATGAAVALYIPAMLGDRAPLGRYVAGMDGRVQLPPMPPGTYEVVASTGTRRGFGRIELPLKDGEHVIRLGSARSVAVTVRTEAGEPVADARVIALDPPDPQMAKSEFGAFPVPYPRVEAIPATDAQGMTTIPCVGSADALAVAVLVSGLREPVSADIAPDSTAVEFTVIGSRSVVIPVEAGEVATPAPEKALEVAPVLGMAVGEKASARIDGSNIVVDGLSPSRSGTVLVRAPDGRSVEFQHNPARSGPQPVVSFRSPVSVQVKVVEKGGVPIAGLSVRATYHLARDLATALTGEKGTAVLRGLPPARLDISVTEPGAHFIRALSSITVDLSKASGPITLEVTRPLEVTARITVAGKRVLPPDLEVQGFFGIVSGVERDAEQAEIRFEMRESSHGRPLKVRFKSPSHPWVIVDVVPPEDGDSVVIDVALSIACSLRCTVKRGEQGVFLAPQRWLVDEERWQSFDSFDVPFEPKTPFVISSLEPGRYRIFDRKSGLASKAVEVSPGPISEVELDLSHVRIITGKVITPDPQHRGQARVIVEAQGIEARFGGSFPESDGFGVSEDGSFEAIIPGDRSVVLTVRHPFLRPHEERGRIDVGEDTETVTLELVHGNYGWLTFDPPAGTGVRLRPSGGFPMILRPSDGGEPVRLTAFPADEGRVWFGGFDPGRYDIWIDAYPFTPLLLEDVILGVGNEHYGSHVLQRGSTIRLELKLAEGQAINLMSITAEALDGPEERRYTRVVHLGAGEEPVLFGLRRGRFVVQLVQTGAGNRQWLKELEVDGKSEVVIPVDLR